MFPERIAESGAVQRHKLLRRLLRGSAGRGCGSGSQPGGAGAAGNAVPLKKLSVHPSVCKSPRTPGGQEHPEEHPHGNTTAAASLVPAENGKTDA